MRLLSASARPMRCAKPRVRHRLSHRPPQIIRRTLNHRYLARSKPASAPAAQSPRSILVDRAFSCVRAASSQAAPPYLHAHPTPYDISCFGQNPVFGPPQTPTIVMLLPLGPALEARLWNLSPPAPGAKFKEPGHPYSPNTNLNHAARKATHPLRVRSAMP